MTPEMPHITGMLFIVTVLSPFISYWSNRALERKYRSK